MEAENNEIEVQGLDGGGAGAVVMGGEKPSGVITALGELGPDVILDEPALAAALGLCSRTIRRMVRRHELPPPIRFGGRGRWRAGAVLDHFKARAMQAEKEAERELARIRRI